MCPVFSFLKTYGKDLIFNGLVPLFGVFIGAFLAYLFQKRAERARERNAEFAACNRAFIALSSLYGAVLNLRKHIEPSRNEPDRHIHLKPLTSTFRFIKIDADSLIHFLDFPEGGDQLLHLLHAQAWVEATMDTLNWRNQVHLDLQRTAVPVSNQEAIVNPGLSKQLADLTNGLYEQVDTSITEIETTITSFTAFLKKINPGRTIRRIERSPEERENPTSSHSA